jgi:hypothetical protein
MIIADRAGLPSIVTFPVTLYSFGPLGPHPAKGMASEKATNADTKFMGV